MTVKDVDEALATLGPKHSMMLGGKQVKANVSDAITSIAVVRSITEAPTLTLGISDPHKTMMRKNVFGHRLTTRLDPFTYEVVSISKQGTAYTVTCEDQVAAELRKHNKPLRVKPEQMTHVQFAKQLVSEVNWIKFRTATGVKVIKSLTELTRGDPTDPHADPESTWDALARIAGDRGWRVFVRGVDELWYVPDEFLFKAEPKFIMREGKAGIDTIDFEIDEGQPIAELSFTARSAMWRIPPGVVVRVDESGPADGKWLVADVQRSPGSLSTTGNLIKPQAVLPEPKPDDTADVNSAIGKGPKATVGTGSGGVAPKRTDSKASTDFVHEALSQVGTAYVYGASPRPSDADPTSFDCSALVQWAAARVNVSMPRTSGEQYAACSAAGTTVSVERAEHIRGALLFEGASGSQHVAISLGNGDTIEARGTAYGTGKFSAAGRPWTGAGLCPGMKY